MIIRRANHNDLDNIVRLYNDLHEEDAAISKESAQSIWKVIQDNQSLFTYVVAEIDGELAGTCNVSLIPNLTRGGRPIALIENVVTHRSFRRRGVGRAMIQKAVDIARERNCYKVMLMTNAQRKEAHQFYERIGFSATDKQAFVMKLN